ncbi:MAG TPA: RuvX/YqgF family protein, partial [Candidatus Krumholzibacteria bacterium]|nr:RuvX/YqgF family protein [Candidatus Krumholzibacteria bacterium]
MTARVLAIDPGERRVGLAVSDPLGITAQGLPTFDRRHGDLLDHIETLIRE